MADPQQDKNGGSVDRPFSFPLEPYPIQLDLMRTIYEAIEQGQVAILESPTGTGKSLSTICAALSWLEANEKRLAEEWSWGLQEMGCVIKEVENDPDWLNAHKRKLEAEQKLADLGEEEKQAKRLGQRLEEARERQKRIQRGGRERANSRRKRRRESADFEEETENKPLAWEKEGQKENDTDLIPSDSEEERAQLSPENEIQQNEEGAEAAENDLQCVKLIYASRTHSQLEQFAKELEKTRFRPRILTLGSRQMLCVNDAVRGLGQTGLVNDRCNELLQSKTGGGKKKCGCEFARGSAIEDLSDAVLASPETTGVHVQGMAQLISLGRQRQACPYLAGRTALGLCQLVLVPYNILLHKGTRQAWKLALHGNVLLVDEAHNLLQALASIHSVELNAAQLDACCRLLHDYLDRFRTRLSARNLRNVRQLHNLTQSLRRLISMDFESNEAEVVLELPDFLARLGESANIDLFRLHYYLDSSKLCRKLRDFQLRYQREQGVGTAKGGENSRSRGNNTRRTEIGGTTEKKGPLGGTDTTTTTTSTPLYQLREFIEAITCPSRDARIIFSRTNSPLQTHLRFVLLNPADKLCELVTQCRALVLLGGTMRPTEQLLDAFQRVCRVPVQRIVEFSCGHVINPGQLVAVSLGKGPDQCVLNLQFANRSSQLVTRSLAQTFINLVRQVPNGSVAFFPSYAFLEQFVKSIHVSGHLDQLERVKRLFVENRNSKEDIWPAYCEAARTARGALLLSVVGGTLSEGINFCDELGRCVFMVGLPYPSRQSAELRERMKLLDSSIGPGAGNRLYEQLCLRSLNQAIGRAIRHRDDYAAIVLLDERFARPSVEDGLPGWIRDRLVRAESFAKAMGTLVAFFRTQRQRITQSHSHSSPCSFSTSHS